MRKLSNKRKKKPNANLNTFKGMVSEHRANPSSDPEGQDCQPWSLHLSNQLDHMSITASIGSLGDVSIPFASHLLSNEGQDCQPSSLNLTNQLEHKDITASIGSLGDVGAPFVSHLLFDEVSYVDL